MKKYLKKSAFVIGAGAVAAVPFLALAANSPQTLRDVIELVITYLGYSIPLIMSLSVVTLIWGIYQKFFKVDADKGEAGNLVLFGVVGLAIMLTFWGMVRILVNTFNLDGNIPGVPFVKTTGAGTVQNPGSKTLISPGSGTGYDPTGANMQ